MYLQELVDELSVTYFICYIYQILIRFKLLSNFFRSLGLKQKLIIFRFLSILRRDSFISCQNLAQLLNQELFNLFVSLLVDQSEGRGSKILHQRLAIKKELQEETLD